MFTDIQVFCVIGEYKFKDIVIENGVPAIIDKDLFEKAQKKISVNKIHLYDDYALITCNHKDGTEKITLDDIEELNVSKPLKAQKNKPEQECSDLFQSGEPFEVKDELFTCSNVTVLLCPL